MSNPRGLQAVWECLERSDDLDAVLKLLEWHKERIRLDASGHLETLIENSNKGYFCMSPVAAAASYITLEQLVFGGALHCNQQSGLNGAMSQDELEKYLQHQWKESGQYL